MKNNFEYIKLFMEYESDAMTVVFFYEIDLDNQRLAVRSIEVFQNKKIILIEDFYHDVIEVVSIPTTDELNANIWGDVFQAFVISKDEFENIWENNRYDSSLSVT